MMTSLIVFVCFRQFTNWGKIILKNCLAFDTIEEEKKNSDFWRDIPFEKHNYLIIKDTFIIQFLYSLELHLDL